MGGGESLLMFRPGEIYLADTDAGKRPVVIVLREELNRGRWVVAVLITSTHFPTRSVLPHCVPLRAGEFGLTKDCVAQAETITFLAASELDLNAGALGVLDESRMRDLIRAVGNMMGSACEPL
jgi:mRNA-degrading endonuclease toxin of MazEF toxin-antitoxin module